MSAIPTQRFADPDTVRAYPLPVSGPAPWRHRDGAWRLALPLPDLSPGTILVPSLASAGDAPQRYRWTLRAAGGSWPLLEIPAAGKVAGVPSGGPVSTHIDCFHIHRPLPSPVLHLTFMAAASPSRYLVTVSTRALTLAVPPLPRRSVILPVPPPPRSQLRAPEEIAQRICSPTCVSMVLSMWHRPHDWLALTESCRDPVTDTYGVWPLAIAAAARHDCVGAVEVFPDWTDALDVLDQGVPVVTSIRFGDGELPDAPLPQTNGHLVVVYGAGPDVVHVCDPAGADGEVVRRYPAAAFSGAWLRHRGAAYILPR
ncbi:MAG: C39 family peptidase [Pseudomonadales bacterium]